jgi:hypothetical protein
MFIPLKHQFTLKKSPKIHKNTPNNPGRSPARAISSQRQLPGGGRDQRAGPVFSLLFEAPPRRRAPGPRPRGFCFGFSLSPSPRRGGGQGGGHGWLPAVHSRLGIINRYSKSDSIATCVARLTSLAGRRNWRPFLTPARSTHVVVSGSETMRIFFS